MKIVSSIMQDIIIEEGAYHALTFESGYHQSMFRQLLGEYFANKKQSECDYLSILNSANKEISGKDFYFISFDCQITNLKDDKNTNKLMQELLFFQIENNPQLVEQYIHFNEQISIFVNNLEFAHEHLHIEFQPTEKTITTFIKSLNLILEYNDDEYVPNYILRYYLIKSLLKLNAAEKEVVLLLSFPEIDMGTEDYQKFIDLIKGLNLTTIVITSELEFLSAAAIENMMLINRYGKKYDILGLRNELKAFEVVKQEDLSFTSKRLAYCDFRKSYTLLEPKMWKFLKSSKF